MDKKEAIHIARLSRLKFGEDELANISNDMSGILKMVDILQAADTTSVKNIEEELKPLRVRKDEVTVANLSESLIKNAPEPYEHFFTVPKMVE